MSRVKLSKLSDEEIVKLMESVMTSDEEDSDSECDNGYEPEEISPEDEHLISQCLRDMDTSENVFTEDPNFSITTSAARDSVTADQEKVSSTGATYTALTSTPIQKKRARSPLPTFEDTGPAVVSTNGGFIGNIESISKDSAEFGKVVWRNTNLRLHVNEVAFRGATLLPENVKALSSPLQLFLYFFSEEIIDMIVQETNRCARSEDINTSFSVTADDIRKYIGIYLYMSIYRYPNIEAYWGKNAFEPIRKTMPVKRFLAIKRFISFRDEEERVRKGQPGYDPLFRIRNFLNLLNERFDSIPKHARLCVDEQMCSTKMKHHLRQYMPNKPHKWGIKLFVLCDSYGYAYRFEIYNGAGDNVILPNCPDLGSSANVVVRLSQTVNNLMNHIIYFDNFYTSLPLLVYLRARGIFGLGTIRMNRIPNCKLPPDSVIVKKERGFSTEYVGSAYGIDISTVIWKDNKSVRLASTYVGVEPFVRSNPNKDLPKAKRYDRKKKQHIQVNCPQIIREYNSHMGGVDLMDGLMGRYHVRAKTRDAMTRLFYHFIDMASTNAYILYKRISAEKMNDSNNIPEKGEKMLQLPEFREEIAAGLINCTQIRLVGRPSTSSQPPITQVESLPDTLNIGRKAVHPVDDVRFSNNTHLPKWLDKKGGKKWCKLCKKSQTQCVCEICNLHLCCSATKNCFSEYHTKT